MKEVALKVGREVVKIICYLSIVGMILMGFGIFAVFFCWAKSWWLIYFGLWLSKYPSLCLDSDCCFNNGYDYFLPSV